MERGHRGSGGRRAQAGSEFGDAESAWALLGTSSATAAWRVARAARRVVRVIEYGMVPQCVSLQASLEPGACWAWRCCAAAFTCRGLPGGRARVLELLSEAGAAVPVPGCPAGRACFVPASLNARQEALTRPGLHQAMHACGAPIAAYTLSYLLGWS